MLKRISSPWLSIGSMPATLTRSGSAPNRLAQPLSVSVMAVKRATIANRRQTLDRRPDSGARTKDMTGTSKEAGWSRIVPGGVARAETFQAARRKRVLTSPAR